MTRIRPTLLVYNTADRLLSGDLIHAVTVDEVQADLSAFPETWPVAGVGTTNWLHRNGEVIPDGRAGGVCYWWADPAVQPIGTIIDLGRQQPADADVTLVTPTVGDDDTKAHFPFLAMAVCDPARALTWTIENVTDTHAWLTERLAAANIGVAGIQVTGRIGNVRTADAYNVPLTGMDLSKGYSGEDYFRFCVFEPGEWVFNGVYAAPLSLQPFISVPGLPLHLHGYQPATMVGGHILSAETIAATATVWPLDDVVLRIHNVAHAVQPVQAG